MNCCDEHDQEELEKNMGNLKASLEETALSLKEEVGQLEAYLEQFVIEYEAFRENVLKFFQEENLFRVSTFEASVVLTSRIGQTAVRSYTGAQVELHNYILGIRPMTFDLSEEGYGTLLGISFENSASVAPWAGTDWVVLHPRTRMVGTKRRAKRLEFYEELLQVGGV